MLTKEQMHSIVGELWVENSPKIFEFLNKYADTKEKQDACLQTIRDRQAINRIWMDQIGVWSYEASGVQPPTFDGRFKWPQPRLS
jgi:hypothetical protein